MAAKSGDVCASCRHGRLGVVRSVLSGEYQVRYLRCSDCRRTDKEIVSSSDIRRRRSRTPHDQAAAAATRAQLGAKTRFDVLRRDGFRCVYCGKKAPQIQLHVDHVVPIVRGGGNELSNLVSACSQCNLGKGKRPA